MQCRATCMQIAQSVSYLVTPLMSCKKIVQNKLQKHNSSVQLSFQGANSYYFSLLLSLLLSLQNNKSWVAFSLDNWDKKHDLLGY